MMIVLALTYAHGVRSALALAVSDDKIIEYGNTYIRMPLRCIYIDPCNVVYIPDIHTAGNAVSRPFFALPIH